MTATSRRHLPMPSRELEAPLLRILVVQTARNAPGHLEGQSFGEPLQHL